MELLFLILMKKYSIEQLEYKYDKQIAEIARKQWLGSGEETVSMSEILDAIGEL